MAARARKHKIAAIADLHVKDGATQSLRPLFAEISGEADMLVIAGDLTDLGKPDQAEALAADLGACSIPVVAVLGNHDHECGAPEKISDILKGAGVCMLDGQSVVIDGVGVAGAKGFAGGFGRYMLGSFGEPAIKAMVAEGVAEAMKLENAIRQLPRERSLVILHYSPIPETLKGEPPEIFPFLGSSRLAETIDRFAVSLVVHGHAHGGVFAGRTPGGTPVYNVAAHVEKPNGKPYAIFEV